MAANRKMNQQQRAAYNAQQQYQMQQQPPPQQQQQRDESVLLCTSGYDRQIRFWEAPTGICNRQISTGDSQVNVLVISPDKKYLAAGGNPTIKLYQVHPFSREPIQTFEAHTNNVISIGFPIHQKWLFSASEDGSVKIWDRRSGVCQRDKTIRDKKTFVNCAVLHPNQGEIICADQSGTVSIYDIAADKLRTSWKPEGKNIPIRSVTVSADASMVIAANNRGTCYVYKPSTKASANLGGNQDDFKQPSMLNMMNQPSSKNFNDTKHLVTTHNSRADKNGMYTLTHKIAAHDVYCLKALLSPDARYLATCSSDHSIKIFDVAGNFKLQSELKGHRKWVWDMAFSADSAYLVSASSDKTAKLWDVKKGQKIITYEDHTKGVTCVALNDSSTQ
eukprot:CAMPEP_0197024122 /NCGR_PEP_ID=MMETSP1384-20130603/4764_1 /TAXON_ID=29189 /ORGANISM="Ammonia sp." /LENGTH=389 /DNA_ID=CAMNT_0042452463 /DNA_START=37 /DNA_END=1206 /DNA_ORIENTATION=+